MGGWGSWKVLKGEVPCAYFHIFGNHSDRRREGGWGGGLGQLELFVPMSWLAVTEREGDRPWLILAGFSLDCSVTMRLGKLQRHKAVVQCHR